MNRFEPEQSRRLSIIVPIYNEHSTLRTILDRIRAVELPGDLEREIILVDDGSTDGTRDLLHQISDDDDRVQVLLHPQNRGKGAALRTGFSHATGGLLLVQDADLEYDPADYPALLQPIIEDKADVVFGSRFIGSAHRVLYFWHYLGNKLVTLLSNMFTNVNLTDMECCYKLFRREVLERIVLEEERFGFEPEVTAKVARLGVRIYEVPVSYAGRTYAEGKKINWKDGLSALRCIVQYGVARHPEPSGDRYTVQPRDAHSK